MAENTNFIFESSLKKKWNQFALCKSGQVTVTCSGNGIYLSSDYGTSFSAVSDRLSFSSNKNIWQLTVISTAGQYILVTWDGSPKVLASFPYCAESVDYDDTSSFTASSHNGSDVSLRQVYMDWKLAAVANAGLITMSRVNGQSWVSLGVSVDRTIVSNSPVIYRDESTIVEDGKTSVVLPVSDGTTEDSCSSVPTQLKNVCCELNVTTLSLHSFVKYVDNEVYAPPVFRGNNVLKNSRRNLSRSAVSLYLMGKLIIRIAFFIGRVAKILLLFVSCLAQNSEGSIIGSVSSIVYSFPDSELSALKAIFDVNNGDNWNWREPYEEHGNKWSFSPFSNPCTENWQGIRCSSDCVDIPCRVLTVNLDKYNLTGQLPHQIENLTYLTQFSMFQNYLTGTLPPQLCHIRSLQFIDLDSNHLKGTIPVEFGGSKALKYLYLYNNRLRGTIPPELGNLKTLQRLDLGFNFLKGTIPKELGNLYSLQYLDLSANFFKGAIPGDLGNLSVLRYLYLFNNRLTGTIPEAFGDLKALLLVDADTNELTGSLPAALMYLQRLIYFDFDNNQLTGTIPTEVQFLVNLEFFELFVNYFTGTIPAEISNLRKLRALMLNSNLFSGVIPYELGELKSMQNCDLDTNSLIGMIPTEISSWKRITSFYVYLNHLTGGLTSSVFDNWTSVVTMDLRSNYFTGTIPATFESLAVLEGLYLDVNCLTSVIPSQLTNLTCLGNLALNSNFLTGTITPLFSRLQSLGVLLLFENCLTGTIPPGLSKILFLYLYSNLLSGTIPSELFQMHSNLVAFVASDNCLTGSIPGSVCDALNLRQLLLDGMGSASACQHFIFPGTSNKAYMVDSTSGILPVCLFQLPRLIILHLSGMMLEGSLANVQYLPASLRYLSLSYNKLTNTIPDMFWQHAFWLELDLSFNRFNGYIGEVGAQVLSKNFSLGLQLNRLSGSLPSSVHSLSSINILNGNMFSCDYNFQKLPQNDPYRDSYLCGSDYVNATLYALLGVALLVFVTLLGWVKRQGITFENSNVEKIELIGLHFTTKLIAQISWYCLFLLLPVYCALKASSYGTYTSQYIWIISSCYLTGKLPALVLFSAYNGLLGLVYYGWSCIDHCGKGSSTITDTNTFLRGGWLGLLRVLVGFLAIGSIDAAYVYGVNSNLSRYIQALMMLALSLVKAGTIFIVKYTKYMTKYEMIGFLCYSTIVAPYAAELFVSRDCFYYATVKDAPSVSSFVVIQRYTNTDKGLSLALPYRISLTYNPPFVYSYTCSSSLVTNFAGVFLLRYIWTWVWILLEHLFTVYKNRTNIFPEFLQRLLRIKYDLPSIMDLGISLLLDLAILSTFGVLFSPLAMVILVTSSFRVARFTKHYHLHALANETSESKCINETNALFVEDFNLYFVYCLPCIGMLAAWFWSFILFDTMGDDVGPKKASGILIATGLCPFLWFGGFLWMRSRKARLLAISNATNDGEVAPERNADFGDNLFGDDKDGRRWKCNELVTQTTIASDKAF